MRGLGRLLLILAISLATACGKPSGPLNVIIIGVDTLRPDHLGCYGYQRRTSPNIDRLAREGVLFENVASQAPWTLPSFATVFTSLYPTQHGAGSIKSLMRTSFPPLAMMLLKKGYSTGAIINAPALKREFGVNRGFEFYDVNPPGVERTAEQVTKDALDWIDLNRAGPFFIFVHYFDPHLSYSPPAPYDTLFDPDYSGRIGNFFDLTYFPRARVTNFETMKVLTPADWNHIKSLYDGEIAYTDKAVGALLAGLEERGLRKNSLLVFLSDHGEEFFEHGGFEHGHSLFQEQLRVPLIFSLPGVIPENSRRSDQVRLLDVAPTILDLVGLRPETHLEGVSLRPLLTGRGEIKPVPAALLPPDVAFAEAMLHGPETKSVIAYPWKLIYNTVTGKEMLFNLEADPGEMDNLIDQQPESYQVLEEVLFKTLFGLSSTWYVEACGKEGHSFDLEIAPQEAPIAGSLTLFKFMNDQGRFIPLDRLPLSQVSDHIIKMEGLQPEGTLTLAFQLAPKRAPVDFYFRIDGQPALERTFMGETMAHPEEMPFTQQSSRQSMARGTPQTRPEAPYFLVWYQGSDLQEERPVRLDDEIKKELRALGYIQ